MTTLPSVNYKVYLNLYKTLYSFKVVEVT